jgi:hypothetical protein
MTNTEIRMEIARKLGFDTNRYVHGGVMCYHDKEGRMMATLPNFPDSLDAMHEAQLTMSPLDHQKFCLFLHKIIMGTMDNFDINGACNLECVSRVVKADARQRAEAFLKTYGLWKE